jgi:DUF4097 and DUF4098 domain-containing protein YvlB
MKRLAVTIIALAWAAAMLGGVVYLVVSTPVSNLGISFGRVDVRVGHSPQELLKEESIPAWGIESLSAIMSSERIELIPGNGPNFVIRQYGRRDTSETGIFTAAVQGSSLHIAHDSGYRGTIGIASFSLSPRLIVEVPPSFGGNVSLQTSSGGIRLEGAFTWSHVNLTTSSGSIRLYHNIAAHSLSLSATSGGIRVNGAIHCTETVSLRTHSGGITADGEIRAESLHAQSTSGGIRLNRRVDVASFDMQTHSGGIRGNGGISGTGRVRSTSGGINLTLALPLGDVDASASSGGITLTVPRGHSFTFQGNTSSGSIRANFDLLFRGSRNNDATAEVGSHPRHRIDARATSGGIRIYLG